MRRFLGMCVVLLLAGCAAKVPPPVAVAPPAPVPAPAPVPQIVAPNYAGLAPEALRARLGAPAFSRKDGPTEMWRYDAKDCRAFFFFTGNQVSHIETMPEGQGDAPDPSCINSLKKAS